MAKYHGMIGFIETKEVTPGVWTEEVVERPYYGEMTRNMKRYINSESTNDNITISNSLSIIAAPYASQNFQKIYYVTFMGTKWKVENAEVQFPRITLSLGGLYNE